MVIMMGTFSSQLPFKSMSNVLYSLRRWLVNLLALCVRAWCRQFSVPLSLVPAFNLSTWLHALNLSKFWMSIDALPWLLCASQIDEMRSVHDNTNNLVMEKNTWLRLTILQCIWILHLDTCQNVGFSTCRSSSHLAGMPVCTWCPSKVKSLHHCFAPLRAFRKVSPSPSMISALRVLERRTLRRSGKEINSMSPIGLLLVNETITLSLSSPWWLG